MIRLEDNDDWLLLTHKDHAALAGEFARHWKNQDFSPPEPFAHILDAVSRHDDSWAVQDATPSLSPEGEPAAFSKELVGTYDAFEDIDLEAYLSVRSIATEDAAIRDPYAAVLISMHSVNLLTEQADLSSLNEEELSMHSRFIEGQLQRQHQLKESLRTQPDFERFVSEKDFLRGFHFLQACDSFSLFAGVDFKDKGALRHTQPKRNGVNVSIELTPLGNRCFQLSPWPLDEPKIHFSVPYRRIPKSATSDLQSFRAAYSAAKIEIQRNTVTASS